MNKLTEMAAAAVSAARGAQDVPVEEEARRIAERMLQVAPGGAAWLRQSKGYSIPSRDEGMYPQRSTFSDMEVQLVLDYVFAFRLGTYKQLLAALRQRFGVLSSSYSHEDLFEEINAAVESLLELQTPQLLTEETEMHPDFRIPAEIELRLQFYCALLQGNSEERQVVFGDCSTRDGAQSCDGRALPISYQCAILKELLCSGVSLSTLEVNGGAIPQLGLKESLVGVMPVSFLERARRVMDTVAEVIREVLRRDGHDPEDPKFTRLFDRYTVKEGDESRRILPQAEIAAVLQEAGVDPEGDTGREVLRIYAIKTTALFRGKFCVALNELPVPLIKLLTRRMHQCGIDVIRVFDALNYIPNMVPAIEAALEAGALVQPVLHADPLFSEGISGYIKNMQELLKFIQEHPKGGLEKLEAIVVKDAPGIVNPQFAFNLSKALSEALRKDGVTTTLVFHTHATSGQASLSAFEFVRGVGAEQVVRLECGLGMGAFSSPNGQPDWGNTLRALSGTAWLPGTKPFEGSQYAAFMQLEQRVVADAKKRRKSANVLRLTTADRVRMTQAEVGLPGGMTGTYLPEIHGLFASLVNRFGLFRGGESERALFHLALELMGKVNHAMGNLSRVTPISNWIGQLALKKLMALLSEDYYVYDGATKAFVKSEDAPEEDVVVDCLNPMFADLLREFAQVPDLLALYPTASRELMRKAMEGVVIEGITEKEAILAAIPLSPDEPIKQEALRLALGKLETLRELVGRRSVDSHVIAAMKVLLKSDTGRVAIGDGNLTREDVIRYVPNPLFMTKEELTTLYSKELDQLCGHGRWGVDELVILSCFQQGQMGPHFIECREMWLKLHRKGVDHVDHPGVPPVVVLGDMGVAV